jgi:hypothetical protein
MKRKKDNMNDNDATRTLSTSPQTPRFQVWCTEGPLDRLAPALASHLTLDGAPVLAVDAAGSLGDARIGTPPNLRILAVSTTEELQTALWTALQAAGPEQGVRRVLLAGALEPLYSPGLSTRDAARILGRMKRAIEAMVDAGVEVAVACRVGPADLGARLCLLSSLCAAAERVVKLPAEPASAAEQHVDRPAAAIA